MLDIDRLISIIQVLCEHENGATAGMIAKVLPQYTKGQIETTCKGMVGKGGLSVETVPHRPNINKNIYHVEKELIDRLEYAVVTYDSHLQQKPLPAVAGGQSAAL